jgi:hypothetical protein
MGIAFVEPPQVDFKLQVLHMPVTSIPGVYSLTRYFLQQGLESNVSEKHDFSSCHPSHLRNSSAHFIF